MQSFSDPGGVPVLGAVEMRLSDDDRQAIARLVAAEVRDALGLSDEALSALRPSKVAELLDVSPGTIVQWEREGKLEPFIRDGRVVRYARQDIAGLRTLRNRGAS